MLSSPRSQAKQDFEANHRAQIAAAVEAAAAKAEASYERQRQQHIAASEAATLMPRTSARSDGPPATATPSCYGRDIDLVVQCCCTVVFVLSVLSIVAASALGLDGADDLAKLGGGLGSLNFDTIFPFWEYFN